MTRITLPDHDVVGIRADNPGPFTLTGTNTWIVGREPTWVIDPGPDLPAHLDALSAEIDDRGGLGAILITHDHHDHVDAVPELRDRFNPVPVASARSPQLRAPTPTHGPPPHIELHDGDQIGPLHVLAIPGHAPDHLVFLTEDGVAYTGDTVLGEGSVFVAADLAEYLDGLERLRAIGPQLIAPGHGPVVTDAVAKLSEYIDHRMQREFQLLKALKRGCRSADALLDDVWNDTPTHLRVAAGWTLAAHLEKLQSEGRLPSDVQWPQRPDELPAL